MNPTVGGVTLPGDEPIGVHGIEMVGEGGLPDPDRFGQLPLVGGTSNLEVEQHQPDRQRASRLGERLIEGPPHDAS